MRQAMSLRDEPHDRIVSPKLAAWLEDVGDRPVLEPGRGPADNRPAGPSFHRRGTVLMANRLTAPPELAPDVRPGMPAGEGIELWAEWLDTCDAFLVAGLRRRVGPDGDVQAAYRQWYAEQMAEHDRTMLHLLEEFDRRSRSRGR